GRLEIDFLPAQECAADNAGEGAAVVGRDRVLVLELGDVNNEGVVGGKYGEVGVVARRQLALLVQADQLCRGGGHPLDDLLQGDAAVAGLGPDQRQAKLQRGN